MRISVVTGARQTGKTTRMLEEVAREHIHGDLIYVITTNSNHTKGLKERFEKIHQTLYPMALGAPNKVRILSVYQYENEAGLTIPDRLYVDNNVVDAALLKGGKVYRKFLRRILFNT